MRVPPCRRRDGRGRGGSDAAGAEERGSLHGGEEGRPRHFFSCSPLRAWLMQIAEMMMLGCFQCFGLLAGVAVPEWRARIRQGEIVGYLPAPHVADRGLHPPRPNASTAFDGDRMHPSIRLSAAMWQQHHGSCRTEMKERVELFVKPDNVTASAYLSSSVESMSSEYLIIINSCYNIKRKYTKGKVTGRQTDRG